MTAEDRERSVHSSLNRVHHRGRVVVVWPDAGGVRAGRQAIGKGLAGLDIGPRAREAGDVRPVGGEGVVDAVEMHRVRRVQVEVQEVNENHVADPRMDRRARDSPVLARQWGLPVRAQPAVDNRVERRLGRVELHAGEGVLAVRNDVPGMVRHGRDPVLAHGGRGGSRSRERARERSENGKSADVMHGGSSSDGRDRSAVPSVRLGLRGDLDLPVHVRAVDAADVRVGAGRRERHLQRPRQR